MKPSLKQTFCTLGFASSLIFAALTPAHAELDIEEKNVIYINASLEDGDDSIYPENWSDEKKIRDKTYNPHTDSSQNYLHHPRYFVINGKNAVYYYPLSESKHPALLYTRLADMNFYALTQSYGSSKQPLNLKPQLPNQLKDHQLFSIQQHGKNLILIFRSRYVLTLAEKQHNASLHSMFADNTYRISYELIEVTAQGKLLHRTSFIAPNPENGMSFGPKLNEKSADYDNNIIEYQTKTPGEYRTIKPYDIEHLYDYQHGKLSKHTQKYMLSPSERAALKEEYEAIDAEKMEDEYRESQRGETPEPSSCLNDFWVFNDKAAPKAVHWGNPWLQQQTVLYAKFLKEYEQGISYKWPAFRQLFCKLK